MASTENLMNSLMKKLYTVLTDGNDDFNPRNQKERFITWCLPGIPFDPEELRFLHQGMIGQGATPAEKGADTALLAGQASRFARFVDFIPATSGIFNDEQQLVAFHRNENSLSRVFERILIQSQVADTPLTDEEKAQIANIRKQLYVEQEIEIVNPDTFAAEKQAVVNDGPLLRNYKIKQALYEAALKDFKDMQIAANVAATPEAVLRFQEMGSVFADKVHRAMDDWETGGQKHLVERMMAFVDDITSRSLLLWKEDVQNRFALCKKGDLASGTEYLHTTLIPGRFAATTAGWSEFSFSESETKTYEKHKSTAFKASGGFGFGGFKMSGGAAGSSQSDKTISDVTDFSMTFSVAQIPLSRPWFDPSFLESRAWRMHKNAEMDLGGEIVSDGKIPPSGILPAYPTSVIFIRDVVVNFAELHDKTSELRKHIEANGKVGWGSFGLGGNYKRDTHTKEVHNKVTKDGLKVDGMQVVGFRCHCLKQSPNPLETIPDEAFA